MRQKYYYNQLELFSSILLLYLQLTIAFYYYIWSLPRHFITIFAGLSQKIIIQSYYTILAQHNTVSVDSYAASASDIFYSSLCVQCILYSSLSYRLISILPILLLMLLNIHLYCIDRHACQYKYTSPRPLPILAMQFHQQPA